MATSLASQLKQLEAPQTNAFKARKSKLSFLYASTEAAGIDCDTHYSNALDGLAELIELDPGLERFRETLFSESSKTFERGTRDQDENHELDQEIEQFLLRVITPFFIRVDSHKVLEYLIYKYRIHEFNTDALIASALPYHGTSLFPRLLQSIPSFKNQSQKWAFLQSAQKLGSPITRNVLVNRCISEQWLMNLITDTTGKEVCASDVRSSGKFATFATSIMLASLVTAPDNEDVLTGVRYFIDKGISSSSRFFVLSAYTVATFASSKVQFVASFVKKLLSRSCRKFGGYDFSGDIVEEFVLMIAIIIKTQSLAEVAHLPDSAVPILVNHLDLISQTPRAVNFVIRKFCISLSVDNTDLMIKLIATAESLHQLDRDTVSAILSAVKSSFESPDISLTFKIKLLRILLSLAKPGIAKKKRFKSLIRDGEAVSLLIDKLTLVEEDEVSGEPSHRKPFNIKSQEWRDVAVLLEILSTGKKINNPDPLLDTCQQLLRESHAFEDGVDVVCYRKLLVRVIRHIVSDDSFDWENQEVQLDIGCIIDTMKSFRRDDAVKDCVSLIKLISKHKKDGVIENVMRIFSFVGSKYGNCDDKISMSLMDGVLCDLIPDLTSGDKDSSYRVIDSLVDNIFGVAAHRRLPILDSLVQLTTSTTTATTATSTTMSDNRYDYVILSLLRKTALCKKFKSKRSYVKFCAQLLSSLKLKDITCYLEQLFHLLHQTLASLQHHHHHRHYRQHSNSSRASTTTKSATSNVREESYRCCQKSRGENVTEKGIATTNWLFCLSQEFKSEKERTDLVHAITKIMNETTSSDVYVQKVAQQQQQHKEATNTSGCDEDDDDDSLLPLITDFVHHVIDADAKFNDDIDEFDEERGKLSSYLSEVIQNATLSLNLTQVMSLVQRILIDVCKDPEDQDGDGISMTLSPKQTSLATFAIEMIHVNTGRIMESKEQQDNKQLFSCVNLLAKLSTQQLNSIAAAAVSRPGSEAKKARIMNSRDIRVTRKVTPEVKLIRSSLSMLKTLSKALGEVRGKKDKQTLSKILDQLLNWFRMNEGSAGPAGNCSESETFVPWIILAVVQLLKCLGPDVGNKHIPLVMDILFQVLLSSSCMVVASGMTSLSAIIQMFPQTAPLHKEAIISKLPHEDKLQNLTGHTKEFATQLSQSRQTILSALASIT